VQAHELRPQYCPQPERRSDVRRWVEGAGQDWRAVVREGRPRCCFHRHRRRLRRRLRRRTISGLATVGLTFCDGAVSKK
jgi:hypothetical protein